MIDDEIELTQSITNTNGWQNWKTLSSSIHLPSGTHKIRLKAGSDGFNMNWFKIGNVTSNETEIQNAKQGVKLFPNPGDGIFQIQCNQEISAFLVFNLVGSQIARLEFSNTIDLSHLKAGIYFLKALSSQGDVLSTKKLIIRH